MSKKIYVLDTCVLLHDPASIYKFEENDVYIPLAVIDDLDNQKKLPGALGYLAREVLRHINEFDLKQLTSNGVDVNEKKGKLFLFNIDIVMNDNLPKKTSDNAIINSSLYLKNKFPDRDIIIVTKDIGLSIRAMSWGCETENYQHDFIQEEIYSGISHINITDYTDWDIIWKNDELNVRSLSTELQSSLHSLNLNQGVIFQFGTLQCPAIFKNGSISILKDKKQELKTGKKNTGKLSFCGIEPKNIEQNIAMNLLNDQSISLLSLSGKAGTGKGILTIASSLHQILVEDKYDKLVYIKPTMPVGGKTGDIGFLPGDKFEKLFQWVGPLRDNIEQLNLSSKYGSSLEELVQIGKIEVESMAYIQGRSIPRAFIVFDESQNVTKRECRMLVERCAEGSKVVLLGDMSQIENPYLDFRSCGLAHAINGSINKQGCASITLTKVERSALASIASEIFK